MLSFILVCRNIDPAKVELEMKSCLFAEFTCRVSHSSQSVMFEFHQPLMTSGRAIRILDLVSNWLSVRHVDASIRNFSFASGNSSK